MRFIDDALDFLVFLVLLSIVLSVALPKVVPAIYELKDDISFIDKSSPAYLGYGIESNYDGTVSLLDAYMMVQVQDGGIPDVDAFRFNSPTGRLYTINETYDSEYNINRVRDGIVPDLNYLAGYSKLYNAWRASNPNALSSTFDIIAECFVLTGVASDCSSNISTTLADKKAVSLAIKYNGGTLESNGVEKLVFGNANSFSSAGGVYDFTQWSFRQITRGTTAYAVRDYIPNGSGGFNGYELQPHLVEPVVGLGPIRTGLDNPNISAYSFAIISEKGAQNRPYTGTMTHKIPLERNSSYLFSADAYCYNCNGRVDLAIITESNGVLPIVVGGVTDSASGENPIIEIPGGDSPIIDRPGGDIPIIDRPGGDIPIIEIPGKPGIINAESQSLLYGTSSVKKLENPVSITAEAQSRVYGTPSVKKLEKRFTTNAEALTLEIIFTKTDSGGFSGGDIREAFVFDNISLKKIPTSDPHYEITVKTGDK